MKSKKGMNDVLGAIIFILIIFLLIFVVVRGLTVGYDSVDYQEYCEYKYGKYFYQSSNGGWGVSDPIRYCYSVNESGDIEKYYFMKKQVVDVCEQPNFFELNKWIVTCGEK